MYDLYETIKSECIKKGTTVSAMCTALGMSKSMMSDLHSGKKKSLSTESITKIAHYFGVTVDFLLDGEEKTAAPKDDGEYVNGDPELTSYLEMLANRSECRMLFSLAKDATKEDVELAVQMIEALRKKEGRE